jgi:hypothetical protein
MRAAGRVEFPSALAGDQLKKFVPARLVAWVDTS